MEQNKQRQGLVNFLALLIGGIAVFAVARYTHSVAGQVGALFLGMGTLVGAVGWFQMRLEDNERLEKLEFEEMAKLHGGSAMFEAKDAEVFPAQRSREQFERLLAPIFTVILCLLQAGGAYLIWRWLSRSVTIPQLTQTTTGIALFATVAVVLFMVGRFSATIARLENQRLLRPSASYVLLNAVLSAVVALDLVLVWFGYPLTDTYIAFALCGLLAIVSVETLINLLLEMYRPRVQGKVGRPLYESRLVGLLGQPEGLVTTAAQALDYQFGFKVSETWFYRLFFEKALKWLVLAQVCLLILSTCVVFIEAGEQGLLERFGRPVRGGTVLEPGGHLKWPWPIDKVYRSRTDQIQSFEIGPAPTLVEEHHKKAPDRVVLWTVEHSDEKEDNFLVAGREDTGSSGTNAFSGKRIPPVSFLTGTMPVQFQITNLVAWAYNNEDPSGLLQSLARREIVRFLLNADVEGVLSDSRLAASETLRDLIQTAANEQQLGVRIVSLGLQDMHPPVKVAADYEKVIAAMQARDATILNARADGIRTNAQAEIQALKLVNGANAQRSQRELGALAQAILFTNQVNAFQSAPAVYAQRAYLQRFSHAVANARKYVLLTTNTQDVLEIDLQESVAQDLLQLTPPQPKKD
jgi:regulator of protease activity HflC (stomatin/prohibitin superfamily)